MPRPNFLIIGAAKAGTTAIHQYIGQHPSIFMPTLKEARLFSKDLSTPGGVDPGRGKHPQPTTIHEYEALFANARDEQAIGEASPTYLPSPIAARQIHDYSPGMRIITVLRHPVDRAKSQYTMSLNWGGMPIRTFTDVFREQVMRNPGWRDAPGSPVLDQFRWSLYYDDLSRYYAIFPREQILALNYGDFVTDPEAVLGKIFGFLGVDPSFRPNMRQRHNVDRGTPRPNLLNRLILEPSLAKTVARRAIPQTLRLNVARFAWRFRSANAPTDRLSRDDRAEFTEFYREDILKTQALTNLDLSDWLSS